jgi:hypothetical protein
MSAYGRIPDLRRRSREARKVPIGDMVTLETGCQRPAGGRMPSPGKPQARLLHPVRSDERRFGPTGERAQLGRGGLTG